MSVQRDDLTVLTMDLFFVAVLHGFTVRTVMVDMLQDITGLNKQIASLQEFSKRNGVGARKEQGRGHSQLVVVGLQSKLASVSKDFQSVLQLRTEVPIPLFL